MEERKIQSLEALRACAEDILQRLVLDPKPAIITLAGDLGAGKTAFVKELSRTLGIVEEVTSPTFVIMKSYSIPHHERFTTLTHMDAYRIESEDELRPLKLELILEDTKQIVCIEWPERIPLFLKDKHVHEVHIAITEGETRTITYAF